MKVTVVREPWRPQPLAWIHRTEARLVSRELQRSGCTADVVRFDAGALSRLPAGPLLLRLSDPVMLRAAQALERASIAFLGPRAAVMERCYDKYEAYRAAAANGVDCPATALAADASSASLISGSVVLKPRRGSDSIGVRLLEDGALPAHQRNDRWLAQEQVRGVELTVGVLHRRAGRPLRIELPPGTIYSFARKYYWRRPARVPLADAGLAERARQAALDVAAVFGVNWAARVDFIHETDSGRLRFLECDVVPLIGAASAFAASLTAGGVPRAEQLRMLLAPSS